MSIKLYTIGFTKKSAELFFEMIKSSNIKKVIDVRLNNVSQLAGFAKRDDLKFFLNEICNCKYEHKPMLAPTQLIFDGYKKKQITWDDFVQQFNRLLVERKIENTISKEDLNNACLLCSEAEPQTCHRRLVAEFLKNCFNDVEIIHL